MKKKANKVIIISGATATGKSKLAIALSKQYGTHVVNFDSLLFYKELNIGTAKPTEEEKERVPHHLISFKSIQESINAADFSLLARNKVTKLHQQGIVPMLVGGSGFYLQALLNGMEASTPLSPTVLERSEMLYKKQGIVPFREFLKQHDPFNFHKLHENDHYRIRRAVEYFWSTGKAFSSTCRDIMQESNVHSWEVCHINLCIEKHLHWDIIYQRSKEMVENGIITEVTELISQGFSGKEKPLQSIGYKEVQQYLNKAVTTKEKLIETISISTRQLAKAQKTFFCSFHVTMSA